MGSQTHARSAVNYPGRVAVLMGGQSAERAISLQSGTAVLKALQQQGVDARGVDLDARLPVTLERGQFDRAFIALHGRGGEDGQIQGLLECLGLPYTGTGVLGSALAMDKLRSKQVWQSMGLPTPDFMVLEPGFDTAQVAARLGMPVMVKPAHEGSSIGISKVNHADELASARELAIRYDDCIIAERWIGGGEYTVPVLHGKTLPLIKLETEREFYDYQAKYEDEDTRYLCPCGLDEDAEARYGQLGLKAFAALGGQGWGRVDFMLDAQGQAWLIEVNTVPGMTSHSLVPMSADRAGIHFDELVLRILETSEGRRP